VNDEGQYPVQQVTYDDATGEYSLFFAQYLQVRLSISFPKFTDGD